MDFSHLTDKDYVAIGASVMGGILRILLNIDEGISKQKQFVLLFFAALPIGWSSYLIAVSYGYHVFAFPAGFFSGLMALSIALKVARDGAGALFAIMVKKGGK